MIEVTAATSGASRLSAEQLYEQTAKAIHGRFLDDLLTVGAHDVKAGLRGVTMLSEWLTEHVQGTDERADELLRHLSNRVERLKAVFEGLISYTGVVRDQDEPSVVCLVEEAQQVLTTLDAAVPVTVHGDEALEGWVPPRALRWVLSELVRNASDHGRPSTIRVEVVPSQIGARVYVIDDGVGLADEERVRAQELFSVVRGREDDATTAGGVGLATCRTHVAWWGGEFGLLPAGERGLCAWFTVTRPPRGQDEPSS